MSYEDDFDREMDFIESLPMPFTVWVCDLCDSVFQGRDNQTSMTCFCGGRCQEVQTDA